MTPPAPNSQELLIRVDERTSSMQEDIAEIKANSANYVTHAEFAPVRSIVFGGVAFILVTVLGILMYVAGIRPPTP